MKTRCKEHNCVIGKDPAATLLSSVLDLDPMDPQLLTETLIRIPFFVIGRCSLMPTSHWLQGKCARINLPHAVSGGILQNHMRLPVSIFSVEMVALWVFGSEGIGRNFKISK